VKIVCAEEKPITAATERVPWNFILARGKSGNMADRWMGKESGIE